jgi:pimeloyl-ACP methyl ester carboxylesterase
MFEAFERLRVEASDAVINLVRGGEGPPVLLLHGYPQTHSMWHAVAPRLAENFTVVATDLRGYGDSSKPFGSEDHATYSKRAMAADQVQVMESLGFPSFAVVGHDRGGVSDTGWLWITPTASRGSRYSTSCRRATCTPPSAGRSPSPTTTGSSLSSPTTCPRP